MRNSKKYFALALSMMASACTYDFPETAEPTQHIMAIVDNALCAP